MLNPSGSGGQAVVDLSHGPLPSKDGSTSRGALHKLCGSMSSAGSGCHGCAVPVRLGYVVSGRHDSDGVRGQVNEREIWPEKFFRKCA